MFVVSLNCILIRSLPLAVLTLVDKETQSLANGESFSHLAGKPIDRIYKMSMTY